MTDARLARLAVATSLRAHLEFMLPDGAWDNSWGTRNYKWTYWGSRTSDGTVPGISFSRACAATPDAGTAGIEAISPRV